MFSITNANNYILGLLSLPIVLESILLIFFILVNLFSISEVNMGKYFITLPSMGESVVEATLTNWLKEVGDKINVDDPIVEIATDKVDSDITSEYQGILLEKKFDKDDVIKVGDIIAVIESSEFQEENIQKKVNQAKEIKIKIINQIEFNKLIN